MKTIRTIIATLSAVLLTFALVAWFSVRRNAAFIQRTIYQGFDQTFVVALVMGCAFFLIAIILTVAIVSTENDDGEDEEEEEEPIRSRPRSRTSASLEDRPRSQKGEQPYRRVSRLQTMESDGRNGESGEFARSRTKAEEPPRPKKKERAAESPDDITFRRSETPVKKTRKQTASARGPEEEIRIAPAKKPKPVPEPSEEEWEMVEDPAEAEETAPILPARPSAEKASRPAEPFEAEEEAPAAEPAAEAEERPAEPEPAIAESAAPEDPAAEDASEAAEDAPEEASSAEEASAQIPPVVTEEGIDEPEEITEWEEIPTEEEVPEEEEPEEVPEEEESFISVPREAAHKKEESTVRCVFCGNTVNRDSRFCPHCGKKL